MYPKKASGVPFQPMPHLHKRFMDWGPTVPLNSGAEDVAYYIR